MEQQGGRRARRRDELLALRALVAELEQKLRALQRQKLVLEAAPARAGPCACLEIDEEEEEATSAAAALWARTARAQKDQRVRAEVENARLRESLEGQLKVARSLDRLLRKRPLQETEDAGQVSRRRPACVSREKEGAVFEELLGRIDGLYAQLDAIWLETGLEINQRERKDAEAKVDADGDIFLEIVNAKIVPFPVDRVSKTVWQLSSMEMQVSNGHLATIESTEDTIKTQFFLTLSLRRTQTPIQMNVVIKRFVNDSDRVVLVWTSEGRPLDTSLGEQDIRISGYGWAVMEKHVMTSMGMEDIKSESSIIQMCVRIVPRFSDSSQQRTRSGLLADMIVGSYTANVTHLIQHAENILLNEG